MINNEAATGCFCRWSWLDNCLSCKLSFLFPCQLPGRKGCYSWILRVWLTLDKFISQNNIVYIISVSRIVIYLKQTEKLKFKLNLFYYYFVVLCLVCLSLLKEICSTYICHKMAMKDWRFWLKFDFWNYWWVRYIYISCVSKPKEIWTEVFKKNWVKLLYFHIKK